MIVFYANVPNKDPISFIILKQSTREIITEHLESLSNVFELRANWSRTGCAYDNTLLQQDCRMVHEEAGATHSESTGKLFGTEWLMIEGLGVIVYDS